MGCKESDMTERLSTPTAPVATRKAAPGKEAEGPSPTWGRSSNCQQLCRLEQRVLRLLGARALPSKLPMMAHFLLCMCWGKFKATFLVPHSLCHYILGGFFRLPDC